MAFFPRNFHNANANVNTPFTPLFRLFDDLDSYSRQGQHGRRPATPQWQPKFDVREVSDAYELYGELPGVIRDDVQIEFSEPQTLVVRGKADRNYTAGTLPAGQIEDAATSDAATDEKASNDSHKTTVEDEAGAEDSDYVEVSDKVEEKKPEETKPEDKKPADSAKYWLTERSIGEFSRSFNFPSRVDQDGVSASMKDGVLSVRVPKAKKHESRRIAVN